MRQRQLALLGVACLLAAALGAAWTHALDGRRDLLRALPRHGVVAAEVGGPASARGWRVTSGSLLARGGALWSGRPDAGPPDPTAGRTGSAVLRAVATGPTYASARVELSLRVGSLGSTARTPPRAWDGVHLFLRYRDPDDLYAVDLVRRDGTLTIKRKTCPQPGSSAPRCAEGTYTTLATGTLEMTSGWHDYVATVRDTRGGTWIGLAVDGVSRVSALDSAPTALRGPGRIGLRGDNADFLVRSFVVGDS